MTQYVVPLEPADTVTVLCIESTFVCSGDNVRFTRHESGYAEANTNVEIHIYSYLYCLLWKIGLVDWWSESVSCIIMIHLGQVGIVFVWKLCDWCGQSILHLCYFVFIICNILPWNPSKSLDFYSIFVDFTLVYCEICGFQLNPQYLQYCKLNFSDCCLLCSWSKGIRSCPGERVTICVFYFWNK